VFSSQHRSHRSMVLFLRGVQKYNAYFITSRGNLLLVGGIVRNCGF